METQLTAKKMAAELPPQKIQISEEYLNITPDKRIFIKKFIPVDHAKYTLVLVHGTAGHGQCYDEFSIHMATIYNANVYAFDLTGHGKTSGQRGIFTFEDFLEDTRHVTNLAAHETQLPVILHGSSQGGEVAFHALDRCSAVTAGICMNLLLNAEVPMSPMIRLMQSPSAGWLAKVMKNKIKVPLRQVINFQAAYQEDPGLLDRKKKDPLYVWQYGFESYRSIFTYQPRIGALDNTKPILVTVGEQDDIVSMQHCLRCFNQLGGPKDFFALPGGGHQLMMFEQELYARIIHSWITQRVLMHAISWQAEFTADEKQYFNFLDTQDANADTGEEGYNYSWLDRVLIKISNGSISRGVRYFSNAQFSKQWQFTGDLVGKIDHQAWQFLKDYVPAPAPDTKRPKIAILGCGNGDVIHDILRCYPAFKAWQIVGVDVDYKAIRRAKLNFKDTPHISFIAGDAANAEVLIQNEYDLIHMHGLFDHCTNHRQLLENTYKALKPNGRLFYITPDRNFFTWISFVLVGPLFVFNMYKSIHDFRRFPKLPELNTVFKNIGYQLVKHHQQDTPAVTGIDYEKVDPFLVRHAVRTRNLNLIKYIQSSPKWYLQGYLGEYVGVVEKRV